MKKTGKNKSKQAKKAENQQKITGGGAEEPHPEMCQRSTDKNRQTTTMAINKKQMFCREEKYWILFGY